LSTIATDTRAHGRRRSNTNRVIGVLATVLGVVLLAYELTSATYVFLGTIVVALVVWLIVSGKRRSAMRAGKKVTLVALVSIGFWIATTTALRFADSGDADSPGSATLVKVTPSGVEMSSREIAINGILGTLALALIAQGVVLLDRKSRGRSRRVTSQSEPTRSRNSS
jgi:hypothetical protein